MKTTNKHIDKTEFIENFKKFESKLFENDYNNLSYNEQINKNEYYKILHDNFDLIIKNDFDLCINIITDLINNINDENFLPVYLKKITIDKQISLFKKLKNYKINQCIEYPIHKMTNHLESLIDNNDDFNNSYQ